MIKGRMWWEWLLYAVVIFVVVTNFNDWIHGRDKLPHAGQMCGPNGHHWTYIDDPRHWSYVHDRYGRELLCEPTRFVARVRFFRLEDEREEVLEQQEVLHARAIDLGIE